MSANTNIGSTPVNQGYVQLIHTGETGGIDGTLRTLYDGDGTASDLQIASNAVKVSTTLYIGSDTLQEYIQDTVGAMLVTNASHTNLTASYDDAGDGAIDLSASGEVTLTGTQTLTNKTLASPTFTGTANGANLTLTGDLTVSGDTIFTNSNNVLIGDAILTLNADETGSPTANAGFEVERGTSANKSFVWNETDDKWTIGSETFVAGTVEANLTGNVTGSASLNLLISNNLSDLANASTARTNLGVDAAGTDNSTPVTLAGSLDYITLSGQQITRNAIDLTTDVTGTLPAGNGGTGLTSISTLLNSNVTPSSLGLVIGTDVQAQDDSLEDISLIDTSGLGLNDTNKFIAWSGSSADFVLSSFPATQMSGSTNNGLLTFNSASVASVESNLTFDGTNLDLPDSKKVRFGTDNDFEMYHDNTNAVINNTKGDLQIYNNADDKDIVLLSDNGSGGTTEYYRLNGDNATNIFSKNVVMASDAEIYLQTGGESIAFMGVSDANYRKALYSTNDDHYVTNRHTGGDLILMSNNGSAGGETERLRFVAGSGTQNAYFSNVNVGIGTTSPAYKLQVSGGDIAIDVGERLYFGGGNHTYISEDVDDRLRFFVGGDEFMRFTQQDAGGEIFSIYQDVYIPDDKKIHFGGGNDLEIYHDGTDDIINTKGNAFKLLDNGTEKIRVTAAGHIIINENGNDQNFRVEGDTDANLLFVDAGTDRVGIGTNSPSAKLHVDGSAIFDTDTGNQPFSITRSGNTNESLQIYVDDSSVIFQTFQDETSGDRGNFEFRMDSDSTSYTDFKHGTATKMRITSAGNVGIGETSPEAKLHIKNASAGTFTASNSQLLIENNTTVRLSMVTPTNNASKIEFGDVDDQDAGILEYNNADNSMRFTTNTSEAMRIDSSGNVGIGTQSPSDLLHIADTVSSNALVTMRVQNSLGYSEFGTQSNYARILSNGTLLYAGTASVHYWYMSGSAQMALNSTGLGIGTASPSNTFEVKSGSTTPFGIKNGSNSTRLQVSLTNDDADIFLYDRNGTLQTALRSEGDTYFNQGNVLIGGTSASGHGFNLEVLNDHAYVKGPDGWNGTGDKAIVALGSGVSNESFGCGYVYGTGLVLSTYKLSGGGDFGSSTQNSLVITDTVGQAKFINDVVAFATSDKRLKENVKPLDNALDKINKINGVEFDWIDGKDEHGNSVHGNEGHDIGVIAQEIEEVLPEVVHTRDNGYKAVKYEKIVPLLIEAIKELKTEIEELKNG